MADIMDAYWRAPAIARTFATAVLATSIGCHLGIIPFSWFYFHYLQIFKLPPEIWRFATSFFITGPQLGIIMDTYFVFQYLSQLETTHPKFTRKEDLLWYLVFVGSVIIVSLGSYFGRFFFLLAFSHGGFCFTFAPLISARTVNASTAVTVPENEGDHPCTSAGPSFAYLVKGRSAVWAWWDVFMDDPSSDLVILGGFKRPTILRHGRMLSRFSNCLAVWCAKLTYQIQVLAQYFLGSAFFLPALILAICYTATQDARGQQASFFFFTVPAQLVPLCMLVATLLMAGLPAMLLQLTGLVAAHLHDFLTRLYPEFGGGSNWIPTPSFFSRFVKTPRFMQRGYGTAFRATRGSGDSGSSTGAQGSGPLPDSWKTRGSGQRLG